MSEPARELGPGPSAAGEMLACILEAARAGNAAVEQVGRHLAAGGLEVPGPDETALIYWASRLAHAAWAAAEAAEADRITAQAARDVALAALLGEQVAARSAPEAAPLPRRRAARHAAGRPWRPLRAVGGKGALPAAVPAAALWGALRHSAAAHAAVAAAGTSAAAVAVAGVVALAPPAPAHGTGHVAQAHASQASPHLPDPGAPVLPSPSGTALARRARPYRPRHASPAPTVPPPVASPAPPAVPPAPSPAWSGTLDVQDASVTLAPSPADPGMLSAVITVYASGTAAWSVDWLATTPGLQFGATSGILADGQPGQVTVSVPQDQVTPGQQWTVTLRAGGQEAAVTVTAPAALP
jgi:hypothetical protein